MLPRPAFLLATKGALSTEACMTVCMVVGRWVGVTYLLSCVLRSSAESLQLILSAPNTDDSAIV